VFLVQVGGNLRQVVRRETFSFYLMAASTKAALGASQRPARVFGSTPPDVYMMFNVLSDPFSRSAKTESSFDSEV